MTFLNELWKKFKLPIVSFSDSLTQREQILNTYQELETEDLQRQMAVQNLKNLKKVTAEPKEEKLEIRFAKIKEQLNTPESHETVRQERWPKGITCPACHSKNLKRLPHLPHETAHKHRYRCLDCQFEFDDESGTPLEIGVPPLTVWMQCWYLLGCTDSLSYIAARLNLDISLVERMVTQLKKLFQAVGPQTHELNFEEWNEQAEDLKKQLYEDLIKQYEHLNANIATTPKDTSEFRRQQNLRRTLQATTAPPVTTPTTVVKKPTTKKRK